MPYYKDADGALQPAPLLGKVREEGGFEVPKPTDFVKNNPRAVMLAMWAVKFSIKVALHTYVPTHMHAFTAVCTHAYSTYICIYIRLHIPHTHTHSTYTYTYTYTYTPTPTSTSASVHARHVDPSILLETGRRGAAVRLVTVPAPRPSTRCPA